MNFNAFACTYAAEFFIAPHHGHLFVCSERNDAATTGGVSEDEGGDDSNCYIPIFSGG